MAAAGTAAGVPSCTWAVGGRVGQQVGRPKVVGTAAAAEVLQGTQRCGFSSCQNY